MDRYNRYDDDRTREFPAQPGPTSYPSGQTPTRSYPANSTLRGPLSNTGSSPTLHARGGAAGHPLAPTQVRGPQVAPPPYGLSMGEGTFAFAWGLLVVLLVIVVPAKLMTFSDGMYKPIYGPYEMFAFALLIPLAAVGVYLFNQIQDV